ncbi:hypothetical protein FIBSPDRAFT_887554 [Athelia psychrophila]|uniref:Uncharacterized protein n=1 Tax=Athelia psychrophila TaxID=1759441 RepID=A0A166PKF1_9AGAM|nr:hypothetical protein FIBSPDRAFT_887554 [Fibularhizoctonia sp. CBS 109695]
MFGHRSLYFLLILALWLAMVVLAIFTALASVASSGRSDCALFAAPSNNSFSAITILGGNNCTFQDHLAGTVSRRASYIQSTHIIIIRLIGTLILLVYKPSLTAMMWSALQKVSGTSGEPSLRVDAFQQAVGLSSAPALLPAALYAKASRTLPFNVLFVLLVSILSLLSPLAISPIYQPHMGPYLVDATLDVGGGVGMATPPDYDGNAYIPEGVSKGRALRSAAAVISTPVFPKIFDVRVAPFLSMATIDEIWSAEVDIAVARNAVDCSASAQARFNSTEPIVALNMTSYFIPNGGFTNATSPTFMGRSLGIITNDPGVAVVYLNSSSSVQPGSVTAETSIIFLGANVTLEGAQQTITSPDATARIVSIDVLICTSTTTLEINHCVINQGNVTSCTLSVPQNITASSTGGLDAYIHKPADVAMALSASAVIGFYTIPSRLTMYLMSNITVATQVLPLSFLTGRVQGNQYHVPLDYITDIVFPQAAQTLVQGMNQAWPVPKPDQSVSLTVTFGASWPQLSYIILAICAGCAITATVSGVTAFRNHPVPLDIVRLLAISQNGQLGDVFTPYADMRTPVGGNVLQRRIGYSYVEHVGGHALVVENAGSQPLAGEK